MKASYSLDEVFEIAEQIERNGAAFYRKASELAGSDETRDLFDTLVEQEVSHEQTFAQMRRNLVPTESSIAVYDKDEIVAIHLQALAGRDVFKKTQEPGDILTGSESVSDVLRLAIDRERDSVIFYAAIRTLMDDEEDRARIDRIIREEQSHGADLNAALSTAS